MRVLAPGSHHDLPPLRAAQRSTYERLLEGGVQIWEYGPSMFHAKTFLVDDRLVVIGSTNLDPLSLRKNEEGSLIIEDPALAKELDLVLQIHDRDAHREVVDVLLADGAPERTVFHCFSGDVEMARLAAEQGWYLSFAGPLTYPANDGLRAALAATPPDRVLLESDAPYLPPHPYRGRPNGPHLVAHTAVTAAAVMGLSLETLCTRVWNTSHEVYGPW